MFEVATPFTEFGFPITVESEPIGLNDTSEVVVASDAGAFSCADVWVNVPETWLTRVTVRLYARLGAARVLLRQVALSNVGVTIGTDTSRSGVAISVRGRPCTGLEVTCQASDGTALTNGLVYLQAWHALTEPSSSGGAPVPEVPTPLPLTAATLVGRNQTTGALTPIATDGLGRLVMQLAPPVPYDLTSLPNVTVVGIPANIGVSDGAPVDRWDSEVGDVFFSATGSDRPSYDADGLGGLPSVVWSDAQKLLSDSKLSEVITSTSAYLAFVLKVDAISSNEATNVYINDPVFIDSAAFFGLFLRSSPAAIAYAFDTAIRKAERPIAVGQPTLLTLRLQDGVLYVGVDGVESTGDTLSGPIGTMTGTLQLGYSTSNKYAGHIGKFAICSAAPSAWTRSQVEASLKAEYGIA